MTTRTPPGLGPLSKLLWRMTCVVFFVCCMVCAAAYWPSIHAEEEPEPGLTVAFDSEDYIQHFSVYRAEHNTITPDPAGSDRRVLRVAIPRDGHYGASMQIRMKEVFGEEPEEAWARYWLYVPEDFTFRHSRAGGKLPGFTGRYGKAGWGGRRSDGTNGWSARMGFARPENIDVSGDVGLIFYTYHAEMGTWGDHDGWATGLPRGEWRRIDQYVRVNTPGERDGVLRGWVDGELALERDDLMFRDAEYEDIRIEEFYFNIYYGGGHPSPVDKAFYFRDLSIWSGNDSDGPSLPGE